VAEELSRALNKCQEFWEKTRALLHAFDQVEMLLGSKKKEASEVLVKESLGNLEAELEIIETWRASELRCSSVVQLARRRDSQGQQMMEQAKKLLEDMHKDRYSMVVGNESMILCEAASTNDVGKLRDVIKNSPHFNVDRGDYDHRTAMHLAASCGHLASVRCLHEELQASLSPIDRWGGTPLDDATRHERTDVIDYLTQHRAEMGTMAYHNLDGGATVLCNLASRGQVDHLQALLTKHSLDVNQGDYDKRTALHIAAAEGRLGVVKLLIDKFEAADSPVDRWGGTPLDDALRHKHYAIVKYLDDRGAHRGLMSSSAEENAATQMCKAASSGDIVHLRTLVTRHQLNINEGDYDSRTAMHLAASQGELDVIRQLMEVFKADNSPMDRWGGTPLDDAIRHNHAEVRDFLVQVGAKRGRTGQQFGGGDSATQLCCAAATGDVDQVSSLLSEHNLSIDIFDYDRRTPLHLAASEGNLESVKALMEQFKAKDSPLDRWGGTPLDDATRHGHKRVVEYLEKQKALRGLMSSSPDENAATEMCKVAAKGDIEHLRALLNRHSLDVNKGDYDLRTGLHLAAAEGQLHIVKMLVDDFHALVDPVDRWGGTPLDDAIRHEKADVQAFLTSHGARQGRQAGQRTKEELATDMCQAAFAGRQSDLCHIVRELHVDVNIGDYDGRTAMHLAASEGKLNVVKVMVEELKAECNPVDRWGGTPLDDAMRHKRDRVTTYLEEKGAHKGLMSSSASQNAAAEMCKVAAEGDVEHLKRLVNMHCLDVNTRDYDCRTAMHLAASEGKLEVAKVMAEDFGANLNPVDRWGNTPLDDAIRQHHTNVQQYLQERGARKQAKPPHSV